MATWVKGEAYKSELIQKLARVSGYRCFYCHLNVAADSGNKATIDEYIPRCDGGIRNEANCRLACGFCNRAKANLSATEFYAWLEHVQNSKK